MRQVEIASEPSERRGFEAAGKHFTDAGMEEDTISSVCFVIALLTWGGFVAFWYAADEPAAAGRAGGADHRD